ncbi:hypothetical protein BH20ACT24_BH20ACT24_07630 [soil metagenome]
MWAMDMTLRQRRTFEQLVGLGPPPPVDEDLADRMRDRLETRLLSAGISRGSTPPVWLAKRHLNYVDRCEGLFESVLLREGPPFEHSERSASGALFHKAIEVDVGTERRFDPRSACERAIVRLCSSDAPFSGFWDAMDEFERAEMLVEAGRYLVWFRDSFPPIERRWAPQTELTMKAPLLKGAVVLSGAPDLVLGRRRRLVLDFKTGRAWPEHPEDMRYYALLMLLRTGVAPYRVATFFLDSGEWQSEDVTEETLQRAADRVCHSAVTAHRLRTGGPPELRPAAHCVWCPRRERCQAASGRVELEGARRSLPA